MNRRTFTGLLGVTTLAACASARMPSPSSPSLPPSPPSPTRIRAVAFDLFTIFDPRGIDAAVAAELPGVDLAPLWKLRAFEYCWLRASAERYAPFDQVVDDALTHALRTRRVAVASPVRARLLAAWTELAPWPDSVAALASMHDAGLILAPLANFAPSMIDRLLAHANLRDQFAHVFSTHSARTFKPARRAYQLGVEGFGLPSTSIAFAAFGAWDAVGATWFGYPTFWVDRLGATPEQLQVDPAGQGPDLRALAAWIHDHNAAQTRIARDARRP